MRFWRQAVFAMTPSAALRVFAVVTVLLRLLLTIVGQVPSSLYFSAALNLPSLGSPNCRVKSSETRQPGTNSPPTRLVFDGEKPSV